MKDCSIFEANDNTLNPHACSIDLASYFFISQGHTTRQLAEQSRMPMLMPERLDCCLVVWPWKKKDWEYCGLFLGDSILKVVNDDATIKNESPTLHKLCTHFLDVNHYKTLQIKWNCCAYCWNHFRWVPWLRCKQGNFLHALFRICYLHGRRKYLLYLKLWRVSFASLKVRFKVQFCNLNKAKYSRSKRKQHLHA